MLNNLFEEFKFETTPKYIMRELLVLFYLSIAFFFYLGTIENGFSQISGTLSVQVQLDDSVSGIDDQDITLTLFAQGQQPQVFPAPILVNQQFDVVGSYTVEVTDNRFNIPFSASQGNNCNGQLGQGQAATCIFQFGEGINIPIQTEGGKKPGSVGGTGSTGGGASTTGSGTGATGSLLSDILGNDNFVITNLETGALVDNTLNSFTPFKSCMTQTLAGQTGTPSVNRYPTSALYTIEGHGNIKELKKKIDATNNKFTIQIIDDLKQDDVIIGYSTPHYGGYFIVDDKFSQDYAKIPFYISDIRTECEYITAVQPLKDNSLNLGYTPLGNIGVDNSEVKDNIIDQDELDKFLYETANAGDLSKLALENLQTVNINPPFAACLVGDIKATNPTAQGQSATTSFVTDKPSIAVFSIKGIANTNKFEIQDNKQDFTIFITVDLYPSQEDLARMVDSNSRVFGIKLVTDPNNHDKDTVSDFNLLEMSTQCLNVDFDDFFLPDDLI